VKKCEACNIKNTSRTVELDMHFGQDNSSDESEGHFEPAADCDVASIVEDECEKEVPSTDVLRNEIEEYIAARGCEGFVAPQTITDYVLNRQGFLACECMNRKIGRMTKELKLSPYVTAGQGYYKACRATSI
jgi:hypothetical protein